MTRETDETEITNRIVATMDICSSSRIIEDLLKTDNIKVWRDLLIEMKRYLMTKSPKYGAKIYKFIGDGWIILFVKPYSGKKVLTFLSGLYQQFEKYYNEKVFPMLDTPPEIRGLTFGLDEGKLIQLTMQGRTEYIGRPINMACRLQGVLNEIDIKGGFRVMISHRLFHSLKDDLGDYYSQKTERPLRNISEGIEVFCYRLFLSDTQFGILEARYGTPDFSIDVTTQYTKNIKNGKLDAVVCNEIAERDPHKGVGKMLKVKYVHKGKLHTKEFKEGSMIQLP
jgi:class 3 adenylate cyclase